MTGATGSTGVPTDRSTMPSGWALDAAVASARVSQGKTGSAADSGPAVGQSSPWGAMSLMACGSLSVWPTFDAPPGEPSSAKKSALCWV